VVREDRKWNARSRLAPTSTLDAQAARGVRKEGKALPLAHAWPGLRVPVGRTSPFSVRGATATAIVR
jgi:hypothetical protein